MQMKVVMVERYVSNLHSFLLHKSLTTWISHVWNFWSNPVASALGFLIWCWNRTSFYWSRVYFNLTSMSIVHSLDARPCAPPSSLGSVQRSPRWLHGLRRALPQHEPERRLHGARQERCQARHSDCFRGGRVSSRCTGGVNMSKRTSQQEIITQHLVWDCADERTVWLDPSVNHLLFQAVRPARRASVYVPTFFTSEPQPNVADSSLPQLQRINRQTLRYTGRVKIHKKQNATFGPINKWQIGPFQEYAFSKVYKSFLERAF